MEDMGEEAALRPPLYAEWELNDSDEEFSLLAQIGANPFGQESKAAAKAAAGGSIPADSLVAEGKTTVTDAAVQGIVGESPRSPSEAEEAGIWVMGPKGRERYINFPFCRWRY
jgi:hypothetical protein